MKIKSLMAKPFANIRGSESKPGVEEEQKPEVDVLEEEEVDDQEDTPWRVILYNDEIHTFDEVIEQLMKALKCTVDHAEQLTMKVHNDGKAKVFEGSFEECFEVNGVLKEIQLITEIKG